MKILLIFLLTLPLAASEINSLTAEEKADGWLLLFNGKDLSNWRTFNTEKPPGIGWKITEEGLLKKVSKIPGGSIISKRKFDDFILSWEWKISPKGNNGIKYLVEEERPKAAGPEYQMLDDQGHPDGKRGANRQTAALYDIFEPTKDKPLKPAGEWNLSKIIVQGNRVEHWLNDKKVLEYELGSEPLKAAIAKSKFKNAEGFGNKVSGHIMLTDHIDECFFKNVKIRPGLLE
ncbi:MAG: DUF1080 domain-containing protein [Akkermansiaceae bacterium]